MQEVPLTEIMHTGGPTLVTEIPLTLKYLPNFSNKTHIFRFNDTLPCIFTIVFCSSGVS